MSENLEQSLRMTHLSGPSAQEAKKELEQAPTTEAELKKGVPEVDPRDKEEFTFQFNFTDTRGKLWTGMFTNNILNIRDQQNVAALAARLGGGLPYESLSPDARFINQLLAHMTFSLSTENRPAWAQDLMQLKDQKLLIALFTEVSGHEAHYFRLNETQKDSGASA